MKRILALILASLMVVSMACAMVSCGEEEEKKTSKKKTPEELAQMVSEYVEQNKEALAAKDLSVTSTATDVTITFTYDDEKFNAEYADDIRDALENYFNVERKNLLDSLSEIIDSQRPEVTNVTFEYRTSDGTLITSFIKDCPKKK